MRMKLSARASVRRGVLDRANYHILPLTRMARHRGRRLLLTEWGSTKSCIKRQAKRLIRERSNSDSVCSLANRTGARRGFAIAMLVLAQAAFGSSVEPERISDPSRMRLGLVASMFPGSVSAKEFTEEGQQIMYFVLPQHGIPETKRHEFASHTQLLDFFEGFPPSVKNNGLWIKRFAPSTWSLSDADRIAALAREANQRKALLHVCQPYLAKPGDSIVTWECKQLSPKGNGEG